MTKLTGKLLDNRGKIYFYDDIYLLAGKRSPFGRFKGCYSEISATDLAAELTSKLLSETCIFPDQIDQLIYSNTIPTSTDSIFIARHIALKSGLRTNTPASLAQRICASGFESIILAANDIAIGASNYALAGGVEVMTRAPLVSFEMRDGFNLGQKPFTDLLWEGLYDSFCGMTMGETAELLAKKYSITRDDADNFAFLSHSRAIEAKKRGVFESEIIPCFDLKQDETIRDAVTLEKMKQLIPTFSKDGVQTAANSSLIADGAVSVIISNENYKRKPVARILSACIVANEPELMGIAPVTAIQNLLKENSLTIDDIDFFEINEAFAAQYLAVEKLLQVNRERVNVNGGSIAIGHPLAATGARLIITLMNQLNNASGKLGIASACVGGGQAIAVLLSRI